MFVGAAEATGAFTELHISLPCACFQHQQPDVWQQAVHSTGAGGGQTGQAGTLVWKSSQAQAGSRAGALLGSSGEKNHFTFRPRHITSFFFFLYTGLFMGSRWHGVAE